MAQLAYYAYPVPGKLTWFETPEGYRIYTGVPVCRTGAQEYYGRELKKNIGYDSSWNLEDEQLYEVFRPLAEVTAAETVASFEGKSVLDEHPKGDRVLVDALDEEEGISKGHGQNVRVGDPLPDGDFAGETPLLADLWVKHPELNSKIEDLGIRQVSCGYTFVLAKDDAGRLIMTKIRGNHVAVVPRGRAGPEIAIGDAAADVTPPTPTQTKGTATMSFSSRLFRAMGFQSWAKDAKPEEVADALEKMKEEEEEEASDKKGARDSHAKDCACKDCKGARDARAAKDAEEAEEERKKKEAADARAAKDAEEKEKKDVEEAKKSAADSFDGLVEELVKKGYSKDYATKIAGKVAAEKGESGGKDAAEVLAPEDRGESEFSVGDAITALDSMRTAIAKSGDKAAIDSYNALTARTRKLRDGVKDHKIEDPFAELVHIGVADAAADAAPERSWKDFFNNGRPYAENLEKYNAYLASKGAR